MSTTRRDFLKSSLGASTLLSLGPTVPAFLARTARAAASHRDDSDTVLIVLQLSGGNDGLNTLVPYDDDVYARSRTTLRLTKNDVHRLDDLLGFHPAMSGFARLFQEGKLSVVQGVGYPGSDRNHPGAMRDWQTGRPAVSTCQTGWLGRTIDEAVGQGSASVPGVFVGRIPRPFALNAEYAIVPAVTGARELAAQTPPAERLVEAIRAPRDGANPLLDFSQRSTLEAYATAEKIASVARDAGNAGEYPAMELAGDLRTVAQLIRADVGIRVFYVELGGGGIGGFDNHAGQRDNHAALLRQLAESVKAFVDDLARDKLLHRVLLMTFSEFGRTVTENGRRGTDHGEAQPVFLAGGRLAGGLIGSHPRLDRLVGDAPVHHTDFRRVYATVLRDWLGFDSRAILGGDFEPLPILGT